MFEECPSFTMISIKDQDRGIDDCETRIKVAQNKSQTGEEDSLCEKKRKKTSNYPYIN